jgi:CBS domain-containing protein
VDDDGVLVGILTERDLLEALMTVLWADSLGEPTHEE